jgi:hypothetical protein
MIPTSHDLRQEPKVVPAVGYVRLDLALIVDPHSRRGNENPMGGSERGSTPSGASAVK